MDLIFLLIFSSGKAVFPWKPMETISFLEKYRI